MGFDLALEGKRIERGVFVHQCSALLLRERAAFYQALIRSLRLIVALYLARPFAAFSFNFIEVQK